MHYRLTWLLISAILIMSLGACAPAAPPRPPLTVSWTLWPGYYPLAIAQQQGLFAKHGVAVKLVTYDTYTAAYTDFASGVVDGGEMVLGDLLLLLDRQPARVVMLTDSSEGADQVLATNAIQTVADLRGKRIGVHLGTYGELFIRQMLEMNGLTVADVKLVNVNPEDVPAAFPDAIDVGHSFEPFTSQAASRGGHVLFTSAQTPGLIPNVWAFNLKTIQERPDDVRAFVAAWFEAVDWLKAHPDEVPAVVAQATGLKAEDIWLDDSDKVFTLADNRAALKHGSDFRSLYYTGEQYVKFLTAIGSYSHAPDLNSIIDPSFIR